MSLPVQTYQQILLSQRAAMQASAGSSLLLDFSPGSVLESLIEANAGNFLWLQGLTTALLATTRLSTSSGSDVDTFIADFRFSRGGGNYASGLVTFSRLTDTTAASVPVGTIVSASSLNNLTFIVTLDISNPHYDPTTNSYILNISTASINVPVQCQLQGTIGNVAIGVIDTINSSLVNVNFVTNAAAYTNGTNLWSDTVTKQMFALYIQSLTRATPLAIDYIVAQTILQLYPAGRYLVVENKNTSGATQIGYFYVAVDDGSSSLNSGLVTLVSNAVESYRGLTIAYSVVGPTATTLSFSFTLHLIANPTESNAVIEANVIASIAAYVNSLTFQSTMQYSKLGELIYQADANIANVTAILMNSATSDVTLTLQQLFTPPVSGDFTITVV